MLNGYTTSVGFHFSSNVLKVVELNAIVFVLQKITTQNVVDIIAHFSVESDVLKYEWKINV